MKRFYISRLIPLIAILLGCNCSAFSQTSTYAYTGSIVSYTVPAGVTSLSITATGAQGGNSTAAPGHSGGLGATVSSTITVVPGDVLNIIAGGQGTTVTKNAGGGGGSFVWDATTTTPLIIAGGGGGASSMENGVNASLTNNGTSGTDGATYTDAGIGGNGAPAPMSAALAFPYGAGGCGWLSNGANGSAGGIAGGSVAQGGDSPNPAVSPGTGTGGAGGGLAGTAGAGGFGGGGGGEIPGTGTSSAGSGGAGGGGGYSGGGGGAGTPVAGGGGGGSYSTGAISSSSVTNTGNGQVVITILCGPGAITGNAPLCVGSSEALNDTPSGGTWYSVNTAIATIDGSGHVLAVAPGTDTILYIVLSDCGVIDTVPAILLVNSSSFAGTITGTPMVCETTTTTLSDALAGGTWSASNTNATVIGGVVTGVTAGLDTIYYTNSCGLASTNVVVTVNPFGSPGTITGPSTVCVGSAITLSDAATGGTWEASNTDAAVSGGSVSGLSAGVDTIAYAVTDACGTNYAIQVVTVNPLPVAGTITGTFTLCSGMSVSLSDASAGGTWSSGNTAVASVTPGPVTGGIVTGVSGGTATITYTVANACGSVTATANVTVSSTSSAGAISGLSTVCVGSDITLTDAATGGVWSSVNTNATVSGGVVTGVSAGTDVISYTVTSGCSTVAATQSITINPAPSAGTISGASAVCLGSAITLTDAATGGTWSASNTNATVLSGTTTGVTAGTDTIKYTVANSCGTDIATQLVTISTMPTGGTITGADTVCIGHNITLADLTTGGAWSSNNSKATVSGGIVTGVTAGLDTIVYTVTNACGSANASMHVLVKACTSEVNTIISSQLNVYPNPVTDELNIENADLGTTIRLFSISGRQVYSGVISNYTQTINTQNLPSGAYMLQLTDTSGSRTTRMVIKQ